MNLFGREVEGLTKVLLILVAIFLVASGMCGVELAIANSRFEGAGPAMFIPGAVTFTVMLLSAAAIVIVLLLWIVQAIYNKASGAPKDGLQKLMDSEDEKKHRDKE